MYKYLCVQDYIMDCEYEGQPPQVAFKKGEIYTFVEVEGLSNQLSCKRNNLGYTDHYMDRDLDFFYHFLLVGEN